MVPSSPSPGAVELGVAFGVMFPQVRDLGCSVHPSGWENEAKGGCPPLNLGWEAAAVLLLSWSISVKKSPL